MADYPSIAGYRINQESPKPERTLSIEYLKQSPEASKANMELWKAAAREGANCYKDPNWFTSDDLPTDREAQLACSSCPVFDLCDNYANVAKNRYGVLAGRVYGRRLQEELKDEH